MKKGETQQVFIYIMVILVVGGIIIFAMKSGGKIVDQGCNVDVVTFETSFKSLLEENSGYGDQTPKSVKSPCGYEIMCFVNSTTSGMSEADRVALRKISSSAADEVVAGTGNNVFLIKGNDTLPLFSMDIIEVGSNRSVNGFLCVREKAGGFNIYLEGIGKGRVKVSEWS